MKTFSFSICWLLPGLLLSGLATGQAEEYEVGGPLAGVKLPLYPTHRGEPPGHPGSIPDTEFSSRRLGAQYELYPGSVEHWSAYWMKYVPVRSLFDRQSMLKNWVAPQIPGAEGMAAEQYVSPIYWIPDNGEPQDTGKKEPPVSVLRCRAGAPVFKLDLGELGTGVYVVRVIGAVETARLRPFRLPLFVALKVNDGPQGEVSTYRKRCNYVDEFYSVTEIYFHALELRHYTAELWLDRGTQVELLVHNITLDNVLAGVERRAIKKRQVLLDEEAINEAKAEFQDNPTVQEALERFQFDAATRLARDEMIWRYFPPINAQGNRDCRTRGGGKGPRGASYGLRGMTEQRIEEKYGSWESVPVTKRGTLGQFPFFLPEAANSERFLVNSKLKLEYTLDDWAAQRPLPDPFPFKDDGAGLYEPDAKDPSRGMMYCPIAANVDQRWREVVLMIDGAARTWVGTRNREIARDGAVTLARYAFALPTIDSSQYLAHMATARPSGTNDNVRFREVGDLHLHDTEHFFMAILAYDYLFDYIQGNEGLAQSIGRFVPWVKTPEDVITLLDTYLVQHTAKMCLRYHYNRGQKLPPVVAVLGDAKFTEPWNEFLFSKIFEYPFHVVGIQDMITSNFDRCGCNYIGSAFYSQRGGVRTTLEDLRPYLNAVSGSKYDLRDPLKYPKPLAHCWWRLDAQVAGLDLLRIGDVRGPDKIPGGPAEIEKLGEAARSGWRWSNDPRFAWILANLAGRRGESDEQWKKIQDAAAAVHRAPWLDLPSRFLANWAGILETGHQHDDYRFRRTVYVRVGFGQGHSHADTLDLQVVAHGLPMVLDDGQRSGYSKPNSRFSFIHNLVEVNRGLAGSEYGVENFGWVAELSDFPGARYMRCKATPPTGSRHVFERQTALIDVDEGRGSQPLSVEQQKPGVVLDRDVATANSYVFDVFRVSGGRTYTYCFHAMVNDDFRMNAVGVKPVEHITPRAAREEKPPKEDQEGEEGQGEATPSKKPEVRFTPTTDAEYLSRFSESEGRKFAGTVEGVFEATWRQSRDGKVGSEQRMLGANFDPNSPRKFTRLHLFDVAGDKVLQADGECTHSPIPYRYTALMIQREQKSKEPLEAAYPALVEPYAGEPFITGRKAVPIANNEADALRAVAVEVKTANGHTDLCFADGRPEKTRQVGKLTVSGASAYCSTDDAGLRACTLTGGTLFDAPEVRLLLPQREHRAKIVAVDYRAKTLRVDQPWPAACSGRVFEVGLPGRWTAFTAVTVVPEASGARFTLNETAEMYRAPGVEVDIQEKTIHVPLEVMVGRGFDENLVASNDDLTKFWHVSRASANGWQVQEGEVKPEDFEPSGALRLWEYGVGDTARMPCSVGLRRAAPSVFELSADVDLKLVLKGRLIECSINGKDWRALPATREGDWLETLITLDMLPNGRLWLRMK